MQSGHAIIPALLLLACVLAAVGGLALAGTILAMAIVLLKPERMSDAKAMLFLRRLSPSDLRLAHEDVHFFVRDERTGRKLRLAGWWIPHPAGAGRCVLILHGYTDAKVGGVAWAPLFLDMGFNVLAIDLRAHGDSEGPYSTAAYFERHDVMQVIDQIRAERPDQTRTFVLFGVSLGAAVAAAVGAMRDDLAAVVLECPYVDFRSALLSHADGLGVPGRSFQRAALWACQAIAGIDYSKVRPLDNIPKIRCPLWVVQSGDDPFVPDADVARIAAAVDSRPASFGPGGVWQVPGCHHVVAMMEDPPEYRRRLTQFIEQAIEAKTLEPQGSDKSR